MGIEDRARRIIREQEEARRLEQEKRVSDLLESFTKALIVVEESGIYGQIESLVELIKKDPNNRQYRVESDRSINPSRGRPRYNSRIATGERGWFGFWRKKTEYPDYGREYKPDDNRAFCAKITWGGSDYSVSNSYIEVVVDKKDNIIILPGEDEIPELGRLKGFVLGKDKFKNRGFVEECMAWAFTHPYQWGISWV